MVYRFGTEELEDKPSLLDDDQDEGEFDELYQAVQVKANQTPEEPASDPNGEPDETLTEALPQGEENESEGEIGGVEPALESVFFNHQQSYNYLLALEDETSDGLGTSVGKAVVKGLVYLAEVGLEYGPVVAKHVVKGVAIALDHTFKAAVAGGKAIAAYVKKRMESFDRFKSRFEEFDKVLQTLEKTASDSNKETMCKKDNLLREILSGSSSSPLDNLQIFNSFFSHTVDELKSGYVASASQLKMLIGKAMSSTVTPPAVYMHDKLALKGFVVKELSGYKPTEEGIVSYAYNKLLPGNVTMVVQIPSDKIKDGPTLVKLNQASKMLLGVDDKAKPPVVQTPYLSLQGLQKFSKTMLEIAETGIQQMKLYGDMDSARDKLEHSVKAYAKHLFDSKEDVTVENSMVDYVSAKFAFMDHTYLAGLMAVHSYTVQYLESALSFAKENAKVLAR